MQTVTATADLAPRSLVQDDPAASKAKGGETWREALQAWVDWNDAHERVTQEMFAAGHNQKAVEDALDRVEQLRRRALELSRKLLGR